MDWVQICGTALRLEGEDSPARAAVEEMLACLPRCEAPSEHALAGLTLSVQQLSPDALLEAFLPAWLLAQIENLPPGQEVALLYGADGDCAALAANSQARYCAWLSKDARHLAYLAQKRADGLTPLSVSSVLVPMLREFFATQGRALVHAAGLQTPCGHGILLLAESGGGKTTSALSLVRAGARLLADDLLTLAQDDTGAVCMHGIPEALNLTVPTMAFFPELEAACRSLPRQTILPNGKRIVRADTVYEKAYQFTPCRLHAICLIELGGSKPSLRAMEVQQAFGRLLHAHTFARGQRPSALAMSVCSVALDTVPAFVLQSGPDPQALGPWLMHAIQQYDSQLHATC